MYITYKTAMQLYELGFHSFWQEHPSRDMVFYKDGICFSLGGNLSDPLTDEEKATFHACCEGIRTNMEHLKEI